MADALHVVHAFREWEPIPGTDEIEQDRNQEEREAWLAAVVHEVVGDVMDVEVTRSTVEDDRRRTARGRAGRCLLIHRLTRARRFRRPPARLGRPALRTPCSLPGRDRPWR